MSTSDLQDEATTEMARGRAAASVETPAGVPVEPVAAEPRAEPAEEQRQPAPPCRGRTSAPAVAPPFVVPRRGGPGRTGRRLPALPAADHPAAPGPQPVAPDQPVPHRAAHAEDGSAADRAAQRLTGGPDQHPAVPPGAGGRTGDQLDRHDARPRARPLDRAPGTGRERRDRRQGIDLRQPVRPHRRPQERRRDRRRHGPGPLQVHRAARSPTRTSSEIRRSPPRRRATT